MACPRRSASWSATRIRLTPSDAFASGIHCAVGAFGHHLRPPTQPIERFEQLTQRRALQPVSRADQDGIVDRRRLLARALGHGNDRHTDRLNASGACLSSVHSLFDTGRCGREQRLDTVLPATVQRIEQRIAAVAPEARLCAAAELVFLDAVVGDHAGDHQRADDRQCNLQIAHAPWLTRPPLRNRDPSNRRSVGVWPRSPGSHPRKSGAPAPWLTRLPPPPAVAGPPRCPPPRPWTHPSPAW